MHYFMAISNRLHHTRNLCSWFFSKGKLCRALCDDCENWRHSIFFFIANKIENEKQPKCRSDHSINNINTQMRVKSIKNINKETCKITIIFLHLVLLFISIFYSRHRLSSVERRTGRERRFSFILAFVDIQHNTIIIYNSIFQVFFCSSDSILLSFFHHLHYHHLNFRPLSTTTTIDCFRHFTDSLNLNWYSYLLRVASNDWTALRSFGR